MKNIILASQSSRRKILLEQIGLRFETCPADIDEDLKEKLNPAKLTQKLSLLKAQKVAPQFPNSLIIASDEVVVFKNKILGKPITPANAKKMLQSLSGRKIFCFTAFTILDTENNQKVTQVVKTKVFIKKLSDEEIQAYIDNGEPLDKAGAFAIQEKGVFMVEKVEGDYNAIIGLPLFSLIETLKKFGISIF